MFYESKNKVWLNSKESEKKNDVIKMAKTIFSSCDCVNPDWSIRMSNADYDLDSRWINAYNTMLYIKDVPVLYTPYLGFSSDQRRRTGLLIPTIGYSKSEGLLYSQPIYFAPKPNYDIELIPQYRAKRGVGMYAYIRYADSINSVLKISGGYFSEKNKFKIDNNLRNSSHYGVDLDYERYNIFSKNKDVKDGIYISINYLNDIEYKTLEDDSFEFSSERNVESKINYIYSTPNYFLGSYFRYYIDTQNDSNSQTMQELPKLQAHSYLKPILFDKLLYSLDFKYTNHVRGDGITANQYELNLPVSHSFSIFDDYLKLTLTQEFNLNKYDYFNSSIAFDDATYAESNTIIDINTDLIKPYKNYVHTMNLGVSYKHSENIKKDGSLYKITTVDGSLAETELSPFPIAKSSNAILFGINQSFYNRDNLKQIINHRLSQSVLYDEYDDAKFQNMENEIVYNYILGSVKNKLTYNHEDEKLVESSSSFSLTYNNFEMKLGHYMSKETKNSGKDELESYQLGAKYKFSNDYSFGYYTNYNVNESLRSKQSFVFAITDKCWNFDLKYEKEIVAASTTNQKPIKQDIIYLQLLLKPLGGIKQEYEINRKDVNN
jgi:LPS-assembly protein